MSQQQPRPMSVEAVLDEEVREVLALLGNRPQARPANPASSVSERSISPRGPRSPVRSMLDVGDDNAGASSESNTKKVPPGSPPPGSPPPVRSMLDIGGASSSQKPVVNRPTSPEAPKPSSSKVRSRSDTASLPTFGPRAARGRADPSADYQFSDIITSNMGQALPKRNTQAGKLPAAGPSVVVTNAVRASDLASIALAGDRGRRHHSFPPGAAGGRSISVGHSGSKSRSPHRRVGWGNLAPNISGRLQQTPGYAVLDDGTVIDMSHAYRKLSDANLAASQGSLSELSARKRSSATEEPGSGRVAKDYLIPDDEDGFGDSSDDDDANDDSDGEASRGREMTRRATEGEASTLLAAAEQERLQVAAQQPRPKYRSLLEPPVTVAGPSGTRSSKPGIHPSTEFDHNPGSEPRSAVASEDEREVTDIKRAQKLAFRMTPIISTAESSRSVRIIYRGEYDELVKTAEEDNRRLRKYMVATDLSEESNHALEWTVGTVLRDGDTLLAIYCVDDETGMLSSEDVAVPDESKAHEEQAAATDAAVSGREASSSATAPMLSQLARASAFGFGSRSSSPAPESRERERERERAEEERRRVVDEMTERVTRLLRKTRLQVKVVVEVIHCRNAKHLITEVIDFVCPTLVILGSRGRSALKGVILGSFSNYLVTKSSVPVMVARKKLRKQSKYRRGPMRQVNNLSNPVVRSLANAKVD
ncbi:hypothetical protein ACRALDRAFT_1082010 [Sodiomyces alcalophilus JCM 7366]|uniref:uncharacterized protein n=1 Tax=Sodiomyces alcalophilus JCM 7366 TaxID=591952 RepID=UPI0039B5F6E9